MNKQVTFGHILTILAMIIIPLFLWGVNVERRFEQVIDNKESVLENAINIKSVNIQMQENHDEQMKATHRIELLLTDKADRE